MVEISEPRLRFLEACARLAIRVEFGADTEIVLGQVKKAEAAWMESPW
jgi:hypothetical protein